MLMELIAHPHWFWLTLGGLLLAAEMLGTSGYLLWCGMAALLVGLAEWLWPFSWAGQGLLFAALTLLSALGWYGWMRHQAATQQPNTLNQRGKELIGRQLTLETPLKSGIGHIQIGDSSWRVQATDDLPTGTRVTVTAVEGITLLIQPRLPPE